MQRWMAERRTINGVPERLRAMLIEDTHELLQTATGVPLDSPAGDGSVGLRLETQVGGATLHVNVRAHVGQAIERPGLLSIPLRWEAEIGKAMFPSFEGTIELEDAGAVSMTLAVIGHYRPPLGPIGQALDLLVLDDAAERTARWLVDRLANALTRRVRGEGDEAHRPVGSMTVADVMTSDPLILAEDLSLRAAAALMLRAGISGVPVCDGDGAVVGVLSERDLLDKASTEPMGLGRAAYQAHSRHKAVTVGEACTRPARVTATDTLLRDAAHEMATSDIDRLLVMDGAQVVGIVTRTDALKALVRDHDDLIDVVGEVLEGERQPDVTFDVDTGIVTLGGQVRTRSQRGAIIERVLKIDGVLDVDALTLEWAHDDTVQMPLMT